MPPSTLRSTARSQLPYTFGVVSLGLGTVGTVFSFVPCCGYIFAFPLCVLGLLLGTVGVVLGCINGRRGLGYPIAGSAVALAGIGIATAWIVFANWMASTASRDANKPVSEVESVSKDKKDFDGWFTTNDERTTILQRVVAYEIKAGNMEEAKNWIRRGLDRHLSVEYSDEAAKAFLAEETARREQADEERKTILAKQREEREKELAKRAEEDAKREARDNPLTMDKYNQIKTGMTYDEIQKIVGVNGEELSRVSIGGITTVMYSWENRGFLKTGNMNVTFQNGRVVAKAQAGLR